jgi:hypothetical protein
MPLADRGGAVFVDLRLHRRVLQGEMVDQFGMPDQKFDPGHAQLGQRGAVHPDGLHLGADDGSGSGQSAIMSAVSPRTPAVVCWSMGMTAIRLRVSKFNRHVVFDEIDPEVIRAQFHPPPLLARPWPGAASGRSHHQGHPNRSGAAGHRLHGFPPTFRVEIAATHGLTCRFIIHQRQQPATHEGNST